MQKNPLVIYNNNKTDTNNSSDTKIGKYYTLDNFTMLGNIVPISWYHTITLANSKPDQIGATIVAELLNQHHQTGKVKFYMNYKYFKKKFNLTRVQTRDALLRLEEKNLVKRQFRTIRKDNRKFNNQMFLCLNLERLQDFCR